MTARYHLIGVLCWTLLAAGCSPDSSQPSSTNATTGATPDSPGRKATASPGCSAAGLSKDEPEPAGLPPEVSMMRKEILKAAVNCDYGLLQELEFRPNGSFQYSTDEESAGPKAQPAAFWRAQEQAGERPLAALVEILGTNPEVQEVTEPEGPGSGSEDSYYNWPTTAGATTYRGYKTSITSRGDWIYFLKQG